MTGLSGGAVVRYTATARLLHWAVALMLLVQWSLGWAAENEADRDESFRLLQAHFQFGALLYAAILLRVGWRLSHRPPVPLPAEPQWRTNFAAVVHLLLYFLMLTMPLSGYVIWVWMDAPMSLFGVVDLPRLFTPPAEDETWRANAWYLHHYSAYALLVLAIVHVGAALWHTFVLRDRLISRRML